MQRKSRSLLGSSHPHWRTFGGTQVTVKKSYASLAVWSPTCPLKKLIPNTNSPPNPNRSFDRHADQPAQEHLQDQTEQRHQDARTRRPARARPSRPTTQQDGQAWDSQNCSNDRREHPELLCEGPAQSKLTIAKYIAKYGTKQASPS